jgi:flagellar biosynthesis protein FlhB
MADDGQEKKHDPGEKKWREAAERGEIPKSADLASAAVVTAGAAAFAFGSAPLVRGVSDVTTRFLDASGPYKFDMTSASALGVDLSQLVATSLAVPLGAVLIAGVVVNLAQTRLQMATKALEIKWERLDIIKGITNMYVSWTPAVELAKGTAKLAALSFAAWYSLRDEIAQLPRLAMSPPSQLLGVIVELGWRVVLAGLPVMLAIAVLDYGYSWWRTNEQLKRTDQEVRDDHKQMEGDPQMKAMRRAKQRELSKGGGLAAVQEAEVVITNPTHYAVALRYKRGRDQSPIVVAKGVDHLAQRIRLEARKHNIPRVENRRLARALHASVPIGGAIPEAMFAQVAKVLAFVYKRRRRKRP